LSLYFNGGVALTMTIGSKRWFACYGFFLIGLCCTATGFAVPAHAASAELIPAAVRDAAAAGGSPEVIVVFDDNAIEAEAAGMREQSGDREDTPAILGVKEARYRDLRRNVFTTLPAGESDVLAEFSHLPMAFMRLRNRAALDSLAANPAVRGIYENKLKYPVLDSQSAALVNAPQVTTVGLTGSGTNVMIIDTGANYTVADLGSCSAAGVPVSCHVVIADAVNSLGTIRADSLAPTDPSNAHGTNVAAIIAGIAPGTKIIVMNVFGTTSSTSDVQILAAINWAIANKTTYNFKAINMSLGDGVLNTATCSTGNPYVTAVANAHTAGIAIVAAAGNDGYTDGINSPACTPGAVSVGAVYSGNFGSRGWYTTGTNTCTDSTTAADQVTCFSNSASFLTLLAPGALITAGGQQFGGTSQATPFISGAAAVLRAAFPAETTDQAVARMTGHGKSVTDARNAITKPRLDLYAAAGLGATVSNTSGGVPMLPEWATLLLMAILLAATLRRAARS
jgi:subtilisin family serine protease